MVPCVVTIVQSRCSCSPWGPSHGRRSKVCCTCTGWKSASPLPFPVLSLPLCLSLSLCLSRSLAPPSSPSHPHVRTGRSLGPLFLPLYEGAAATTAYTVSLWLLPGAVNAAARTSILRYGNANTIQGPALWVNTGTNQPVWTIDTVSTPGLVLATSNTAAVFPPVWVHLALVVSATTARVYRNGILHSETNLTLHGGCRFYAQQHLFLGDPDNAGAQGRRRVCVEWPFPSNFLKSLPVCTRACVYVRTELLLCIL